MFSTNLWNLIGVVQTSSALTIINKSFETFTAARFKFSELKKVSTFDFLIHGFLTLQLILESKTFALFAINLPYQCVRWNRLYLWIRPAKQAKYILQCVVYMCVCKSKDNKNNFLSMDVHFHFFFQLNFYNFEISSLIFFLNIPKIFSTYLQ